VAEARTCWQLQSVLQQLSQRDSNETPQYTLLDEKGPDHRKCFKLAVVIGATPTLAPGPQQEGSGPAGAAMNASPRSTANPSRLNTTDLKG